MSLYALCAVVRVCFHLKLFSETGLKSTHPKMFRFNRDPPDTAQPCSTYIHFSKYDPLILFIQTTGSHLLIQQEII